MISKMVLEPGEITVGRANIIRRFFFSFLILGFLVGFQNCSGVSFSQSPTDNSNSVDLSSQSSNEDPMKEPTLTQHKQNVEVHTNKKVDILFIIDNSGSMSQEHQHLAQRIDGFMNLVKDLDWQIAMTSTDPRTGKVVKGPDGAYRTWGDGEFRSFDGLDGSQFILKATEENLANAQNKIGNAIDMGTSGSGDERGISALSRALNKRIYSPIHSEFFRSDSALVVILISDEDECSNGKCIDANSANKPQNLLNQVTNEFGGQKIFKFHSIIRSPTNSTCTQAYGATYYNQMSLLSGGTVGSICDSDYSQILNDFGNRVIDLVNSVNLECAPEDTDLDGHPNVNITLSDGSQISEGYKLQGLTLTFDTALPEGNHEISYSCLTGP
ncbi:MAG TPA: hypothetical protein DCL41_01170 [Bdellovibrionales bacterium]|nr:hypothetical protein [Bdellovibrionales bacterium]